MTRRIKITGYRLKAGELVPCYKHLPVNIHSCRSAQANECGSAARRVSYSVIKRRPLFPPLDLSQTNHRANPPSADATTPS